jgi:hypothetical protein
MKPPKDLPANFFACLGSHMPEDSPGVVVVMNRPQFVAMRDAINRVLSDRVPTETDIPVYCGTKVRFGLTEVSYCPQFVTADWIARNEFLTYRYLSSDTQRSALEVYDPSMDTTWAVPESVFSFAVNLIEQFKAMMPEFWAKPKNAAVKPPTEIDPMTHAGVLTVAQVHHYSCKEGARLRSLGFTPSEMSKWFDEGIPNPSSPVGMVLGVRSKGGGGMMMSSAVTGRSDDGAPIIGTMVHRSIAAMPPA